MTVTTTSDHDTTAKRPKSAHGASGENASEMEMVQTAHDESTATATTKTA